MGKNLYGALAYNQNKVDEGGAKVLSAHLLRYPEDGRFRPDESVRQFLEWMPNHYRTEKPVSTSSGCGLREMCMTGFSVR